MQITVAGEKKEVKDGLTLPELIEQENVETPEYVTVSINDEFIETEAKATTFQTTIRFSFTVIRDSAKLIS